MSGHPKHLPADERAIVAEAVIPIAAEQIPDDMTTTAIAQRIGLTQSALFRQFPSSRVGETGTSSRTMEVSQ